MEENKSNEINSISVVIQNDFVEMSNPVEMLQLTQRLAEAKAENIKIQTEFNLQRAKLKELFIQKESENNKCQEERQALQRELDELKSRFFVADIRADSEMRLRERKAEEEIYSLQQLVQDTIEETTICKEELRHIKEESDRLRLENLDLRGGMQYKQESESLAPQVLNQVKKSLVRKLGGDVVANVLGNSFHQESIDDIVRTKGKEYAHEDADVLHAIVDQLQEEMKMIKEKLREADEKLQTNSNKMTIITDSTLMEEMVLDNSINKSKSMEFKSTICTSCCKYDIQVKDLFTKNNEYLEKVYALQKKINKSREDLQKEAALRNDLEFQWQEKRLAHKAEVKLLREQVKLNEQQLLHLQKQFLDTKEEVIRHLHRITDERERVNKHLETLQSHNHFLSGRYLATAEEIENQYINLPNTVEELQEQMLRQQSELIQARVGSDFEKQKCGTSLDEIQILRDQLGTCNNEFRIYKTQVQTEIKSLQ